MRSKPWKCLCLAPALALSAAGTARAEDDSWTRYRSLAKSFMYMEVCNVNGVSPMTGEAMRRLHFKLERFESLHGFNAADIDAVFKSNKAEVISDAQSGALDGQDCFRIRESLLANLDNPDVWK